MIQMIASCVPQGHTVDLVNPQIFILVEVFKVCVLNTLSTDLEQLLNFALQSMCGVSVVEGYYDWHKFNVMEIANDGKNKREPDDTDRRVVDKSQSNKSAEQVQATSTSAQVVDELSTQTETSTET